jgi:hypothetical protein
MHPFYNEKKIRYVQACKRYRILLFAFSDHQILLVLMCRYSTVQYHFVVWKYDTSKRAKDIVGFSFCILHLSILFILFHGTIPFCCFKIWCDWLLTNTKKMRRCSMGALVETKLNGGTSLPASGGSCIGSYGHLVVLNDSVAWRMACDWTQRRRLDVAIGNFPSQESSNTPAHRSRHGKSTPTLPRWLIYDSSTTLSAQQIQPLIGGAVELK